MDLFLKIFAILLHILLLFHVKQIGCWQDYEILSITTPNQTTGFGDYKVTVRRINRTSYAVGGYFVLNTDIRKGYSAGGELLYSRTGNNQFNKGPLKMTRKPMSVIMNKEYPKSMMQELAPYSNVPYSDEKGADLLQMLEPGKYTFNNYIFNKKLIPKFMKDGSYKLIAYVYKDDDADVLVYEVDVIFRLV